jgi:tetratricopeptide (TPR) repeat protein
MRLEEVFSVYVSQAAGDPQGLKVVSHSEQMASSRCFLESGGKMWCASCHDPHRKAADKAAWFRERCLNCHQNREMSLHQEEAGSDCAGCHMPRLHSYDGGHTALTDHWIRLKRVQPQSEAPGELRAWREPAREVQSRNLGLAYISAGSKSGSLEQLVKGFRLLGAAPADGAVETARGLVLLRSNRIAEAVKAFRRAVGEQPEDSTRRLNLAAALLAAGERDESKRHAERAVELEPLLEDAYALLAEIQPQRAAYWKDRYRKLLER